MVSTWLIYLRDCGSLWVHKTTYKPLPHCIILYIIMLCMYSICFKPIYLSIGIGVLLSHLPIEQYRSIAWFNVACGVVVLLLFIFLFQGESSWKDVSSLKTLCQYHCMLCPCNAGKSTDVCLGRHLQIFISYIAIVVI